jgi:hypothetical protein
MQINEMEIELSEHACRRISERNVSLEEILYTLRDKIKLIRLYKNCDKELCYRSDHLSYIFAVKDNKITLITALNKYHNRVRNVLVI